MVTRNPSQLLVHDPATNTAITIVLGAPPRNVSLSPDGLRAAVAFDSSVSTVDLQTQAQSATISVPTLIADVVYAGDNRLHVFPLAEAGMYTVALATSAITTATYGYIIYNGSRGRLHPSGQKLYFTTTGLSPGDVHRVNVSSSPTAYEYSSPYHGEYPFGGDIWFKQDGSALISGPTVLRTTDDPQTDMVFLGSLRAINQGQYPNHRWVAHSTTTGKLVTVTEESSATPPQSVRVYNAQTFELEKITPIAPTPVGGVFYPSVPMLVAYRSNLSVLYVLAKPTQDVAVIYEVAP
jgi:hypothetical protein